MAEARLGPDELDRLEDALEGLEELEDLHDPSEAVSNRLADFQLILQASREALPLEDVRPGILDGVLSEARMSATDIITPTPESPVAPSFWARLRGAWLIPGLAVAGSAALVLILVSPMAADSPQPEKAGAVAVNDDASQVRAEVPAAHEQGAAEAEESVPPVANQPSPGDANYGAALAPPAEPPATAPAPAKRSGAGKRVAPTTPSPEPARDLSPATPGAALDAAGSEDKATVSAKGWNAIEEGDSAREGGDCFSARNHYARALDDGNDSVRARAYVGLGLCKRNDGNSAAADEYFDKARELDEDAVKFADTRAEDEPSKPRARRPKKKASRKRKKSMDFDESMDPFKSP